MHEGMKNLRTPTTEQAREIGRKGGKASARARRRKKALRECLAEILTRPVEDAEIQEMLEEHQVENCYDYAMCLAIIKKAVAGDAKAFEVVRDTVGEKPTERVENSQDKPFEVNIRVVD